MDLSKIILMGFMGAGKSSMGILLASDLARPFIDLDAYIEEQEQLSISEIFETKGESHFRNLERKYLKDLLKRKGRFVIAVGGGTPCNNKNIDLLLKYNTIYLKCPIAILADRLWTARKQRPLISLLDNKRALYNYVQKNLSQRKLYYKQANIIVWNIGKPREVLKRILKRI